MNHQIQGHNECLPTSVAMLSNTAKTDVIAWGLEQAAYRGYRAATWDKIEEYGNRAFWVVSDAVLDHFLYPGAASDHHAALFARKRSDGTFKLTQVLSVPFGLERPPRFNAHRDLAGRGILTTGRGSGRKARQHAMAFENGVVYDPTEEAPRAYRKWKADHRRWRVVAIHRIPANAASSEPQTGGSR